MSLPSPIMNPEKSSKRRSSILKQPRLSPSRKPLQDLDLNVSEEERTVTRTRRVSFADTNLIKEFCIHADEVTEWHNTYEEPANNSTSSKESSSQESVESRSTIHGLSDLLGSKINELSINTDGIEAEADANRENQESSGIKANEFLKKLQGSVAAQEPSSLSNDVMQQMEIECENSSPADTSICQPLPYLNTPLPHVLSSNYQKNASTFETYRVKIFESADITETFSPSSKGDMEFTLPLPQEICENPLNALVVAATQRNLLSAGTREMEVSQKDAYIGSADPTMIFSAQDGDMEMTVPVNYTVDCQSSLADSLQCKANRTRIFSAKSVDGSIDLMTAGQNSGQLCEMNRVDESNREISSSADYFRGLELNCVQNPNSASSGSMVTGPSHVQSNSQSNVQGSSYRTEGPISGDEHVMRLAVNGGESVKNLQTSTYNVRTNVPDNNRLGVLQSLENPTNPIYVQTNYSIQNQPQKTVNFGMEMAQTENLHEHQSIFECSSMDTTSIQRACSYVLNHCNPNSGNIIGSKEKELPMNLAQVSSEPHTKAALGFSTDVGNVSLVSPVTHQLLSPGGVCSNNSSILEQTEECIRILEESFGVQASSQVLTLNHCNPDACADVRPTVSSVQLADNAVLLNPTDNREREQGGNNRSPKRGSPKRECVVSEEEKSFKKFKISDDENKICSNLLNVERDCSLRDERNEFSNGVAEVHNLLHVESICTTTNVETGGVLPVVPSGNCSTDDPVVISYAESMVSGIKVKRAFIDRFECGDQSQTEPEVLHHLPPEQDLCCSNPNVNICEESLPENGAGLQKPEEKESDMQVQSMASESNEKSAQALSGYELTGLSLSPGSTTLRLLGAEDKDNTVAASEECIPNLDSENNSLVQPSECKGVEVVDAPDAKSNILQDSLRNHDLRNECQEEMVVTETDDIHVSEDTTDPKLGNFCNEIPEKVAVDDESECVSDVFHQTLEDHVIVVLPENLALESDGAKLEDLQEVLGMPSEDVGSVSQKQQVPNGQSEREEMLKGEVFTTKLSVMELRENMVVGENVTLCDNVSKDTRSEEPLSANQDSVDELGRCSDTGTMRSDISVNSASSHHSGSNECSVEVEKQSPGDSSNGSNHPSLILPLNSPKQSVDSSTSSAVLSSDESTSLPTPVLSAIKEMQQMDSKEHATETLPVKAVIVKKQTLKDILLDECEKATCQWLLLDFNAAEICIAFLFKTLELHIILGASAENAADRKIGHKRIADAYFTSSSKFNKPVGELCRNVFLEKFPRHKLMENCRTTKDLLPLLGKLSEKVKNVKQLARCLAILELSYYCELHKDSITVHMTSMEAEVSFRITVNLLHWCSLTPEDVTVQQFIGSVKECDIKNLTKTVQVGPNVLLNYIEAVQKYVQSLAIFSGEVE